MKKNVNRILSLTAKQIKKLAETTGENHFTLSGFYKPVKPENNKIHDNK